MRLQGFYVLLGLGLIGTCHHDAAKKTATQTQPTAQPPATPKSYPYSVPAVNQAAQHPSLQAFLQQVEQACATRQQANLLALVSDSVAVSYGGGITGKQGFVRDFLNAPSPGSGYEELRRAIRLGGTVSRNKANQLVATFPYLQDAALYEHNPALAKLEMDPFITYVGLAANLPIYARPDSQSSVLTHLPYPVLSTGYAAAESPKGWLRVVTPDSSFQGYVRDDQLYYMAAMTLLIEEHAGQFKITSVAPYD